MGMFCYFCGMEFNKEELKECNYCHQLYCQNHSDTMNHDCPLIPIQNPYDIDTQSPIEVSNEINEELISEGLSEENKNEGENEKEGEYEPEVNGISEFDIETHKSIIENIIAEKAKNPESIPLIKQELKKELDVNEENSTEENDGNKNKDVNGNNDEKFNSDVIKEDSEDEGTEIDTDIPGVYDIEAEFKEPDGFIRPIQIIKHDSPYAAKVKAIENRKKECYFCGHDLSEQKNAKFIRVRNVEESFFKGLGRELKFKFFGSNKTNDGFYLCENPDCVTKWKTKEPVYIRYSSGNVQKYVNEH